MESDLRKLSRFIRETISKYKEMDVTFLPIPSVSPVDSPIFSPPTMEPPPVPPTKIPVQDALEEYFTSFQKKMDKFKPAKPRISKAPPVVLFDDDDFVGDIAEDKLIDTLATSIKRNDVSSAINILDDERIGNVINNKTDEGKGPPILVLALLEGQYEIARAIIERTWGVLNINLEDNETGMDSVMAAIRGGQVHILRQFENSIEVTRKDKDGNTALIHAASTGIPDIVRMVLDRITYPSQLDHQNNRGETALIIAAERVPVDVITPKEAGEKTKYEDIKRRNATADIIRGYLEEFSESFLSDEMGGTFLSREGKPLSRKPASAIFKTLFYQNLSAHTAFERWTNYQKIDALKDSKQMKELLEKFAKEIEVQYDDPAVWEEKNKKEKDVVRMLMGWDSFWDSCRVDQERARRKRIALAHLDLEYGVGLAHLDLEYGVRYNYRRVGADPRLQTIEMDLLDEDFIKVHKAESKNFVMKGELERHSKSFGKREKAREEISPHIFYSGEKMGMDYYTDRDLMKGYEDEDSNKETDDSDYARKLEQLRPLILPGFGFADVHKNIVRKLRKESAEEWKQGEEAKEKDFRHQVDDVLRFDVMRPLVVEEDIREDIRDDINGLLGGIENEREVDKREVETDKSHEERTCVDLERFKKQASYDPDEDIVEWDEEDPPSDVVKEHWKRKWENVRDFVYYKKRELQQMVERFLDPPTDRWETSYINMKGEERFGAIPSTVEIKDAIRNEERKRVEELQRQCDRAKSEKGKNEMARTEKEALRSDRERDLRRDLEMLDSDDKSERTRVERIYRISNHIKLILGKLEEIGKLRAYKERSVAVKETEELLQQKRKLLRGEERTGKRKRKSKLNIEPESSSRTPHLFRPDTSLEGIDELIFMRRTRGKTKRRHVDRLISSGIEYGLLLDDFKKLNSALINGEGEIERDLILKKLEGPRKYYKEIYDPSPPVKERVMEKEIERATYGIESKIKTTKGLLRELKKKLVDALRKQGGPEDRDDDVVEFVYERITVLEAKKRLKKLNEEMKRLRTRPPLMDEEVYKYLLDRARQDLLDYRTEFEKAVWASARSFSVTCCFFHFIISLFILAQSP